MSSRFTVTSFSGPQPRPSALNPQAAAFVIPAKQNQQSQQPRASQRPMPPGGAAAAFGGWRGAAHADPWAGGGRPAAGPAEVCAAVRAAHAAECRRRGWHMLVVLNLEPRTTREQLAAMFFPMGGTEARLLDPRDLPLPLADASRRAGVVFFSSKGLAEEGLKMDNFVPHGQHKPLTVRYAGPDEPPGSPAAQPAAPARQWLPTVTEMERMLEGLRGSQHAGAACVLVHGVDPSRGLPALRRAVPAATALEPCAAPASAPRGGSVAVWFPSREQAQAAARALSLRGLEGQQEPVRACLAGPPSPLSGAGSPTAARFPAALDPAIVAASAAGDALGGGAADGGALTPEEVERCFRRQHRGHGPDAAETFLVAAHNLTMATDKQALYDIFYPMGAVDADVHPQPVSMGGKLRRSGVAVFTSCAMAREAADKFDNFVPHGQKRPLVTRLLTPSPTHARGGLHTPRPQSGTPEPAAQRHSAATPPPPESAEAVLSRVAQLLEAGDATAARLAELMMALYERTAAPDVDGARLAEALAAALRAAGDNAAALSTPVSGALLEVHRALGIPRKDDGDDGGDSPRRQRALAFARPLGRQMLVLVSDAAAPARARVVAATCAAYLFQFRYLPHTPHSFANRLIDGHAEQLRAARNFLAREAGRPCRPEEERQHRPWVALMEALQEMTSQWERLRGRQHAPSARRAAGRHSAHSSAQRQPAGAAGAEDDEEAAEAARCRQALAAFYNSPSSGTDAQRTPPSDVPEGTASQGSSSRRPAASAMVTPSARPTPRPVAATTLLTPGGSAAGSAQRHAHSGAGGGKGGHAHYEASKPPHVMLSAASAHTQGPSPDVSTESAPARPSPSTRPLPRPLAGTAAGAGAHAHAPPAHAAAVTPGGLRVQEQRSDVSECTVYLTKVPASLAAGKIRRLLDHFGDVNKVRLSRDDKESHHAPSAHKLCYGFVEYATPAGAKAIVEFFRNVVRCGDVALDFLPRGGGPDGFTPEELEALRLARASQARSPIHGLLPLDALLRPATFADGAAPALAGALVCERECRFGRVLPHVAVGVYNERADLLAAAEQQQQADAAAALVPACEPALDLRHLVFGTAPGAPAAGTGAPILGAPGGGSLLDALLIGGGGGGGGAALSDASSDGNDDRMLEMVDAVGGPERGAAGFFADAGLGEPADAQAASGDYHAFAEDDEEDTDSNFHDAGTTEMWAQILGSA